jgi:hypothetical protein
MDQLSLQDYGGQRWQQRPPSLYGPNLGLMSGGGKQSGTACSQDILRLGSVGPSAEREVDLLGSQGGLSTSFRLAEFPSLLGSKQTPDPNRLQPEVHFDNLALLHDAVRRQDLPSFLAATEAVDWNRRPTGDFVRTVEQALSLGAFDLAGRLALEGDRLHRDHSLNSRLSRLAYILAPSRVLRTDLPSDPGIKLNREWLKKHAAAYRHRWVAIRNGELLGHADSIRELISRVSDRRGALLMRIP